MNRAICFKVLRWLCLIALDQSDFIVVLSKLEIELLIFREELNKKQNCTTNTNCHAIFSAKGSKDYAGIFLFSKFELYWAACTFVKIHNRQIGTWTEQFFFKVLRWLCLRALDQSEFLVVLSKIELLNFREELNKKLNIQQIIIVTQCFQHKAVKSTLEFFLFSKFGLYWAAFIFVKIHNRQIEN